MHICGGTLSGYDTRAKRFAILCDDEGDRPIPQPFVLPGLWADPGAGGTILSRNPGGITSRGSLPGLLHNYALWSRSHAIRPDGS